MFAILRNYAIPHKIVQSIMTIYRDSKRKVLVNGNQTEEFKITTGVLQGDMLAPFLFKICIDFILKRAEQQLPHAGFTTHLRESSREPEVKLFDLDFADDIALLSGSFSDAQSQLSITSNLGKEIGLLKKTSKTEA